GNCVNISANASGMSSPFIYSWTPNIGNGPGPFTVCPSLTTTFSVQITDTTGASVSDSVTVTVNNVPIITTSAPVIINGGDSTMLSVTGASIYLWSPCVYLTACTGSSVTA